MSTTSSTRRLAFVVPTLNSTAAQNEDIVQLLLVAAIRLEQWLGGGAQQSCTATLISIDPDTSGWKHFATFFSSAALKHITIEILAAPSTPNLAAPGSHK